MEVADEFVVDFPTLGFLASDWIEWHARVPDGFARGEMFTLSTWQTWIQCNHYRVKPDVVFDVERPLGAGAFFYRRSIVIAPQKTGKGPLAAGVTLFEAVGPCIFAGWAVDGDVYRCADHGCYCGFEYPYDSGEPMGMPRETSLIQLVAMSEDQVDNMWRPLKQMVRLGPLGEFINVGEAFARLPNDGVIEIVTSSAQTRLGNPLNFANFDESGLYTKSNGMLRVAQTMSRGLAGMGGRGIEWSNAYDPAENSRCQQGMESQRPDIFKFYRKPPADLSYKNKRDRARIHKYVYDGSPWVNLDDIEAEAAELLETDPSQAERFYGNRIVAGLGSWLRDDVWEAAYAGNEMASEPA